MNRVKSMSRKVLAEYSHKFGSSFADNKKALNEISIISSKGLKNEIAGYITNLVKKENIAKQKMLEQEKMRAEQERLKSEEPKETNADFTPSVDVAPTSESALHTESDLEPNVPAENPVLKPSQEAAPTSNDSAEGPDTSKNSVS